MRREQRIRLPKCVGMKARPAIVCGVGNHRGAHGVQLDVTMASEKVAPGVDETRLEAPLPKGSAATVTGVETCHVTTAELLHHRRYHAPSCARHEQVDVIGHQHVGVDSAVVLTGSVREVLPVGGIVILGEETRLPVVAALDDVLGHARQVEAGLAGHAGSVNGDTRSLAPWLCMRDPRRSMMRVGSGLWLV